MAAQPLAAGPVSSPRSKEITRAPDHSDVNKLDALKASMRGLVFRIEEVCDGAKIVPPLEVILVPEFIPSVWHTHRLVPWVDGFVHWEVYMQYLDKFLELNRRTILTLELDECLSIEKEYVESRASHLSDEERNLSDMIMAEIKKFKKQKDCMSEEDSCLAAAGFMCIATEVKLMSRLTRHDFSTSVRKCAFDLVNKRPGCAAVSAALLGMATEAQLLFDLLKQNQDDYPHLYTDICTCRTVRNRTLTLLTKLQGSFMLDTAGNHDSGVASPADQPTSDNTVDCLSAGDKHLGKKTDVHKRLNKKRKIEMLEEVEVPVSSTSEVRMDATEMGVTEVYMQRSEVLSGPAEDAPGGGAQDSEGKTVRMDTDAMIEPTKENPIEKEMARNGRVREESKEKDAVEAYVYEIRSTLYQKYDDFVTSEDMNTLMAKLQEAEDWLYGDGQDETKEVYVAKLEELKKVVGPIEARCKELEGIGPTLQQLVNCIYSSKEAALSADPKFDYINVSDKDELLDKCSEVETWMIGLLKHADPSDLKKKTKVLDSFCKAIIKPEPTGAAPEVQPPDQHPDVANEPIEQAEQMDTHTPVRFPSSSLA